MIVRTFIPEELAAPSTPFIVQPDGTRADYPPKNGHTYEYEELRDLPFLIEQSPHGWIEIVHPKATPAVQLVIDEEGMLKGMAINPLATAFYNPTWQTDGGNCIHGPALVCRRGMVV